MRKGKINNNETQGEPVMKIITIAHDRKQIETEIDRHVKSIQSLIQRLGPPERQKYYNGLLSHLLAEDVNYPARPEGKMKASKSSPEHDYSRLSDNELQLIRELSAQINNLYNQYWGFYKLNNPFRISKKSVLILSKRSFYIHSIPKLF